MRPFNSSTLKDYNSPGEAVVPKNVIQAPELKAVCEIPTSLITQQKNEKPDEVDDTCNEWNPDKTDEVTKLRQKETCGLIANSTFKRVDRSGVCNAACIFGSRFIDEVKKSAKGSTYKCR